MPEGDVDSIGLPFCQIAATSDLDRVAPGGSLRIDGGRKLGNERELAERRANREWHGVTVDHSGRVTELDIRRNQLSGEATARAWQPLLPGNAGLSGNRL